MEKDNTLSVIKSSLYQKLNALEKGQRAITKNLIAEISRETEIKHSVVNGIIPMLIHEWVQLGHGTVEIGRNGGIYKGGKNVRVDPRPRCPSCNQVFRKKNEE